MNKMRKKDGRQLSIEGFAEDADEELAKLDLPENMIEPFNPNEIRIIPQTLSIDNIITRLRNHEIDLNTAFQRKANLWKIDVQSRLIESLMLRLPLPAFYFDASEDDKWLIVDGLQRLSTLKNFVIDKSFTLTGLDILKPYDNKGLSFSELPRIMQRRIMEANITCFLISPGTPRKVKYNVFKRINTGALSLNEMEIRNALNQGNASEYLKTFTESTRFRELMPLPSDRMEDRELILRCVAFMNHSYTKYESPLGSFLDMAMEKLQYIKENDFKRISDQICKSIEIHTNIFGKDRFSRSVINKQTRYKLNSALFETWIVILSQLSDNEIENIYNNQDLLREEYILLFSKKTFNESITTSTASRTAVITRFKEIESLVKKHAKNDNTNQTQ